MNELILLMQASNKLDEVIGSLAFIAKDLKTSLEADNAELKVIRDEIAALRKEIESKKVGVQKKGGG